MAADRNVVREALLRNMAAEFVSTPSSGTNMDFGPSLATGGQSGASQDIVRGFGRALARGRSRSYEMNFWTSLETEVLRPSMAFEQVLATKIEEARALLRAKPRTPINARLMALIEEARGDYPLVEIPSVQSLGAAERFFTAHVGLRAPSLSLTSSGNVWAQWNHDNRVAAIEFLRNGTANIASRYPAPDEQWRRLSLASNSTIPLLGQWISEGGLLGWVRA